MLEKEYSVGGMDVIKPMLILYFSGTCAGACSNTCTGDGRKYDSLAGLGGIRATCLDDNYMCTSDDPYGNMYSVLIHEAAHTVHQYALSETWQDAVSFDIKLEMFTLSWHKVFYLSVINTRLGLNLILYISKHCISRYFCWKKLSLSFPFNKFTKINFHTILIQI